MMTTGQGQIKNNKKLKMGKNIFIKNWKTLFLVVEQPFFLNSHDPMKS